MFICKQKQITLHCPVYYNHSKHEGIISFQVFTAVCAQIGMLYCVVLQEDTNVLEEHAVSIFKVEVMTVRLYRQVPFKDCFCCHSSHSPFLLAWTGIATNMSDHLNHNPTIQSDHILTRLTLTLKMQTAHSFRTAVLNLGSTNPQGSVNLDGKKLHTYFHEPLTEI